MRSAAEIRFRLAQQWANLRMWAAPPLPSREEAAGELSLPDPAVAAALLRGSPFAAELEAIADEIVQHRFRLLGFTIDTGSEIDWRRDYVWGKTSGLSYFRFIPYLDFERVGDHKNVWELNRHQHLVLLAQAWLLTGKQSYRREIEAQLMSWWNQNRFLYGINWTSALEVALRALSWLWLDHLAGGVLESEIRKKLRTGLFQHASYLEHNLSTYFSPNTHLLGEAVALHALGVVFPRTRWRRLGEQIVREELDRQVQADGSHFEQSTYYHVYALDFFLFHYILDGRPAFMEPKLRQMARFLATVQDRSGELIFLGDDDGGRLFHPYGERSRFGRATLATCAAVFPEEPLGDACDDFAQQGAWWLGVECSPSKSRAEPAPVLFRNSGLAVIDRGDLHIVFDAGSFGPGGAGHSHSDALSFTVRRAGEEILIDPGTFTYVADTRERNAFRGSASHNTMRIDGMDQADPVMPFRWENKPEVTVCEWSGGEEAVYLDASCRQHGAVHRRRLFLVGGAVLLILDEIEASDGEHLIEQFWHVGVPPCELAEGALRIGSATMLSTLPVKPEIVSGWRSHVFGQRSPSPVVYFRWRAPCPQVCATVFLFELHDPTGPVGIETDANGSWVRIPNFGACEFPRSGSPHFRRTAA